MFSVPYVVSSGMTAVLIVLVLLIVTVLILGLDIIGLSSSLLFTVSAADETISISELVTLIGLVMIRVIELYRLNVVENRG